MPRITTVELKAMLESKPRCVIGTVTIDTVPDMYKTDNPYWDKKTKVSRLRKRSKINGVLGKFDYENIVNRARIKEGKDADFEAAPRKWGERLDNGLVAHTVDGEDRSYLVLYCLRTINPHTAYYVDGNEVEKSEIEHLLKPYRASNNQGLDKEIVYRNPRLDNIVQLAIDGTVYDIVSFR